VLLDEAIGADAFLLAFIPDLAFRAALDAFAMLLDEAIGADAFLLAFVVIQGTPDIQVLHFIADT
jgi:hypothetical protein